RVTLYDYCACGALGSITRGYGTALSETTSFYYDLQGNRTSVVYPDLTGVTNRYDLLRRPTVMSDALGSVTNYYDNLSRVTSETNANNEVIKYTYNAVSDLRTLTDGKNQVTTWNYDLYGRVTNKLDQASVEILRYSYDANSRLTNRWSAAKGNTVYTYDSVA